jgi:lysozyme family protein
MNYPENFLKAVEVILKHEGGYVNHPNDPGGETKYGISKRAFPYLDIKELTSDKAKEIYYLYYWRKLNIDSLEYDLAIQIFDHAVNAGRKTAVKMLQRIVKAKADGVIGRKTLKSISNSSVNLIEVYKESRTKFYTNLSNRKPKLKVFLKGWINRVNTTLK